MSDKDNGTVRRFSSPSVCAQLRHQMFGVIVYPISRNAIHERYRVRMVSINQYSGLLFLEHGGAKAEMAKEFLIPCPHHSSMCILDVHSGHKRTRYRNSRQCRPLISVNPYLLMGLFVAMDMSRARRPTLNEGGYLDGFNKFYLSIIRLYTNSVLYIYASIKAKKVFLFLRNNRFSRSCS